MPVDIQQFNDDEIHVNDKLIIKDSNDKWIAKVELTASETRAFYQHIKSMTRHD